MADLYYAVLITGGMVTYDLSQDLSSFTLEEDTGQPDRLTIVVEDHYKIFSHAIREGMDVSVDLGTDEEHSVVFRGRIHQVEARFPESGVPVLTLSAHDGSMRMGLRPRNRVFQDRSLSEVAAEVGAEYFSDVHAEVLGDPVFDRNGLRQCEETDLAFLLRLGQEFGCELFVEQTDGGERLHFVAEQSLMTAEPDVTLYHGRAGVEIALLSFSSVADVGEMQLPRAIAALDARTGAEVEVTETTVEESPDTEDAFHDENLDAFRKEHPLRAASLELLLASADAVATEVREELGAGVREAIPTFASEEQLAARVENQFSTRLLGMTGQGTAEGNKDLHASQTVRLDDLGGRFSGVWYLNRVRHQVDSSGYRTEFECRR